MYFFRVTGLLRSGALKEENKPIWYDVYAAFPPKKHILKVDEKGQQQASHPEPKDIFYLEDLIRA